MERTPMILSTFFFNPQGDYRIHTSQAGIAA